MRWFSIHLLLLLLNLLYFGGLVYAKIDMNRNGCGDTKACLFKPAGCNPQLDCTIGIVFYVSEPNRLTIQMVAQSLLPTPNFQYIAVGFSKDPFMGEDFVSECVLSPIANAFNEVEVFASYNNDKKLNDRTYLNQTERGILYDEVESDITDGRITCQFRQQIVPQFPSKNGRIGNLNSKFFIIGATGSSQLDEINVHDTSQGSLYYPVVSARPINPALIGHRFYELPMPYPELNNKKLLDINYPYSSGNITINIEPSTNFTHSNNTNERQNSSNQLKIFNISLLFYCIFLNLLFILLN